MHKMLNNYASRASSHLGIFLSRSIEFDQFTQDCIYIFKNIIISFFSQKPAKQVFLNFENLENVTNRVACQGSWFLKSVHLKFNTLIT